MPRKQLYYYIILFLLFATHLVRSQDTLTTVFPDTTFLGKTEKRYDKMYYFFYGRFVQGGNKKQADTNFIRRYPEYIVLSADLGIPKLTYSISSPEEIGTNNYEANVSNTLGLHFGYKNISFGYRFKLRSNYYNNDQLTPTDYHSFNFKFQNNKLNHAISFYYLKGLTDTGSDSATVLEENYIPRPDIKLRSLSYQFVYNASWRKYSYLAPQTFSQRQIRSRAGFLVKTGIFLNSFEADSAIINPSQQKYYLNFKDITSFSGVAFQLAPGIGSNMVIRKKIYLAALFFVGVDYYHYRYKRSASADAESYHSSSFQYFLDGELSLGYHSERLFFGAIGEWKTLTTQVNDASVLWFNWYAGVKVGYRIKAPALLKKTYKVIFPY